MKELIKIIAELKAPKGQYNSFGKYKYRSCEDILEAVKPLCVKNNVLLTLTDDIVLIGDRFYVKATATVTNLDGVCVSASALAREEDTKKGMDGSQVTGASSSYARKYALNGLFCIDDTKDADATNKHGKEEEQRPQQQDLFAQAIAAVNAVTTKAALKQVNAMYKDIIPTDKAEEFRAICNQKYATV
jgi:hypothetical protein